MIQALTLLPGKKSCGSCDRVRCRRRAARGPMPRRMTRLPHISKRSWTRLPGSNPEPGRLPLFHRLTRTEYKNAIRDLLGLDDLSKDVDLDLLLPADNSSSGFDNIADLLFVSSTQLEQYLSAAQKLSAVAVGDQSLPPLVDVYRMSEQFNQEYQAEGAPFGTRGGTVIRTYLPLDGDYRIHIELADAPREPHQLEIAVDDERVRVISAELPTRPALGGGGDRDKGCGAGRCADRCREVGRDRDRDQDQLCRQPPVRARSPERGPQEGRSPKVSIVDVPMKAGPRAIAVTFLKRTSAKGEALIRPRLRGRGQLPAIASVTIRGPQKISGPGDTPSRRKIFVCTPAAPAESWGVQRRFSRLSRAARTAVRSATPIFSRCSRYYEAERSESGFEAGIKQGLERILVSPQFLFRIERQPAKVAAGSCLSNQRSRTGVAALVFPVEQHSGRRAARARRARQAEQSSGAGSAGAPDASRFPLRGACDQFRRAVVVLARRAREDAEPATVSRLRPELAGRLRARNDLVPGERVSRGPQRHRSAARANDTFMNERLARALRRSERAREQFPPRDVSRRTIRGADWGCSGTPAS